MLKKANGKSSLWYLAWIPLIGWFFTSRAANKSIIWPILILISTCLSLYEFYKGLSDAYNIFNSAASGATLATDIANQPVDYLGWIFYLLALIAEFIILKGLAKTLNFSLTRTVVIFILGGPFWFMRNRLKNQPSTQEETEKVEYL
ncbi:MAG: hypothetical protein Q3988_01530 [Gemella sp.]|nr:hypothetical protein [Gemella sp.]